MTRPLLEVARPLLAVEGLEKRFGGLSAVRHVTLQVWSNEILGLLGPNGAGKTTLFNLITGYIRPDAGRVFFDGTPVVGLPPNKLANLGLSRTFQLCRPFTGMTALENVAVSCFPSGQRSRKEIFTSAEEIIELVGLGRVKSKMAELLPYGDLRRLEIAKALAARPKLLLLDEPFAGLAAGEIDEIASLIRAIRQERQLSVLIIEHHLKEFMELVSRVVALDFGQVIAEGIPSEIVRNPKVVEAYLGRDEAD